MIYKKIYKKPNNIQVHPLDPLYQKCLKTFSRFDLRSIRHSGIWDVFSRHKLLKQKVSIEKISILD